MNKSEKIVTGMLVDIHDRNIYPAEIFISGKHIETIRKVESAPSLYILPGLIDSHIHIESSMVTPGTFAMEAVRHGTVGTVSDPHEIANVLGLRGVDFMIRDAAKVPVRFYFGAPSCVPATEFESSGAELNSAEIDQLLSRKEVKYLSEMMNFPGVINGIPDVKEKLEMARKYGKPVDGHAPGLTGGPLKTYVAAGISTDHECSTIGEAREKINLGMKILIREGSAARNLDALKELIRTDPGEVMLCSDDLHPEMLEKGHINKLISRLVSEGFDLFDVISAATAHPVFHYDLEAGLLRPGDSADFIIVDSPSGMNVHETWIDGEKVFDRGVVLFSYEQDAAINWFNCTPVSKKDIYVACESPRARVITAIEGELLTGEFIWDHRQCGELRSSPESDILKIVVKDRYNDGHPAVGFIKGFGMSNGAFASSVAHDSHNIVCVGTNDEDIVSAINEVIRLKGGLAFSSGNILRSLQLDIAGIMSGSPVRDVAAAYLDLTGLVRNAGCTMAAPFMTLSFMALLVIPSLKMSDRGLFDVRQFKLVNLFV